jgi:type IV fimbrial biogenesis protein FimT
MQIPTRHRQQGVTLIELLVTMSILVILLTVGVGGMTTVVKRNTRATEVNTMIGHLNFARAQAVMRATDIRVCPVDPSNPAAGCGASADGSSWSNGYAVVEVDAANKTVAVLRLQEAISGFVVDSGGRRGFQFEDDGTISYRNYSGNGTISFCDSRTDGVDGAAIVVSPMGRVRLASAPPECDAGGGGDGDGDGDGGGEGA